MERDIRTFSVPMGVDNHVNMWGDYNKLVYRCSRNKHDHADIQKEWFLGASRFGLKDGRALTEPERVAALESLFFSLNNIAKSRLKRWIIDWLFKSVQRK